MIKKIVLTIVIITIAIIASAFYIKSTPQYSLYKMYQSVKNHDYGTFSKFVDVDTLVENLVDKSIEESKKEQEQKGSTDEWEQLGNSFAEGLVALMRPSLTAAIKSGIQKNIESGDFKLDYQPKDIFKVLTDIKIKKNGKTATITVNGKDNKPFTFKMRQKDDYWQVFNMDLDLSSVQK